jgi:hypothetical protein
MHSDDIGQDLTSPIAIPRVGAFEAEVESETGIAGHTTVYFPNIDACPKIKVGLLAKNASPINLLLCIVMGSGVGVGVSCSQPARNDKLTTRATKRVGMNLMRRLSTNDTSN